MAHEIQPPSLVRLAALLATVTLTGACREGSDSPGGGVQAIPLPLYGANGCNPLLPTFSSLGSVSFTQLDIGPKSQLAAASDTLATSGTYELFATGDGGSLVKLVFDPATPLVPIAEVVLLAPGDVDGLPEYASVAAPAELSGVAVLDPGFLVVVENTANTLLLVSRNIPGNLVVFPGLVPNESPGNSNGSAAQIRFSFEESTQLLTTGDGRIFVADSGNHSIRVLETGGLVRASTIAGTGAASYSDGGLPQTGFDTPVGVVLNCAGGLVVAETGAAGVGGHRLRRLRVGEFDNFAGGFSGDSSTIVGDGTPLTSGGSGGSATAAGPLGPVTTSDGTLLWVDSLTGVLRRYNPLTDTADCPFFVDCAAATGALGSAPNFTSLGGVFSLAITEDRSLYALDADAEELWRIEP